MISKPAFVRILGVFAHPDDEIFCGGGTYARYAAAGAEVMVISATRGEAGQIRDAAVATRRTLGDVRERELQASCERLGIKQAICWDFGDGRLLNIDPLPLTKKITKAIREFQPDVVVTFGPDGAYGHPDHIVVGDLTTKAFNLASDPEVFPEQLSGGLSVYSPGRLYYSYFPKSNNMLANQLVNWLSEIDQKFQGTIDFAYALMLFAEEATMLGYSSDNLEIQWYPKGFYIIEQDEPASKLYLILSGQVEAIFEEDDGKLTTQAVLEAGQFFGERGLADNKPRETHVIATKDTTCMVFSPFIPSNFEGRGADAELSGEALQEAQIEPEDTGATTVVDVSDFIGQKVEALSAYRTQFPLEPSSFPMPMLREVFSKEYFVRVYPPLDTETSLFSMAEILSRR